MAETRGAASVRADALSDSAAALVAAPERLRGFMLTTVRHTAHSIRSWEREVHREDELIWSTAGVMRVHAGDAIWTVPAQRAVWMPAGVAHTVETSANSIMQSTFVVPGSASHLPAVATVVELLPVIKELLLFNAETELPPETRLRVQGLAVELLRPSPGAHVDLVLPETPRLLSIAERILAHPAGSDTTERWAASAGMTARSLSQAFVSETGLSLTQWRIRARIRASLVPLGSGQTVAATAYGLGYSNPSTFIEHFRAVVGETPAAYFADSRP